MSNDTTQDNDKPAEQTWPITIKLKHPVELGSENITSLTFRRGKLADLKGLKIDNVPSVDNLIVIASRMSGQTTLVIEKLDAVDAAPVLEVALTHFTRCLLGGAMP